MFIYSIIKCGSSILIVVVDVGNTFVRPLLLFQSLSHSLALHAVCQLGQCGPIYVPTLTRNVLHTHNADSHAYSRQSDLLGYSRSFSIYESDNSQVGAKIASEYHAYAALPALTGESKRCNERSRQFTCVRVVFYSYFNCAQATGY